MVSGFLILFYDGCLAILIEQEGLIPDQLMCSVDVFSNGEVFICKKYKKQQAKRVNNIILVK